jgi:dihydroxyacetone kinase DhaKLM complex PTS-EIIA-like component DhaM
MVVVMSCMNTMMMSRRQADDDHAERLADSIEARSVELMKHGESCDPLDGFNIAEAFAEASTNEKVVMAKMLAERKFDQAGILLDMISRKYWANMAIEMAEKELS